MIALFTPEPRTPRTYAECCLDRALGSCHPTLTWEGLAERGATDDELRWYVGEFAFGLGKGHWSGPGEEWLRYDCIGGANPHLFAVRQDEVFPLGGFDRSRTPDFFGPVLLNAVRELRGIWRPA